MSLEAMHAGPQSMIAVYKHEKRPFRVTPGVRLKSRPSHTMRSAVSGPAMRPPTLRHRLPERLGEKQVLRLGVVKVR